MIFIQCFNILTSDAQHKSCSGFKLIFFNFHYNLWGICENIGDNLNYLLLLVV